MPQLDRLRATIDTLRHREEELLTGNDTLQHGLDEAHTRVRSLESAMEEHELGVRQQQRHGQGRRAFKSSPPLVMLTFLFEDEKASVQRQLDNARAELAALKDRFADALADRDRFQTRALELEVRRGVMVAKRAMSCCD